MARYSDYHGRNNQSALAEAFHRAFVAHLRFEIEDGEFAVAPKYVGDQHSVAMLRHALRDSVVAGALFP